jgi:NADH-quinone oxidoreductase subunit L
MDADALTVTCLLLFMGAMGKSAQFLLHTWLPDAMEGPTPVSALIHAATMVTAGVFMVARLSFLFDLSPVALNFVLIVGATTAFFAATVGLVQNDIKRVIAYSTCSQLGYMFVGLGVGGYSARHLPSVHARLLQGAVVPRRGLGDHRDASRAGHARDGRPEGRDPLHLLDDDDRHAGADRRRPSLHTFGLRRLCLQGRDHRGGLRLASPGAAMRSICVVVAAAFTSFYSWRLAFMTFFGHRGDWGASLPAKTTMTSTPTTHGPSRRSSRRARIAARDADPARRAGGSARPSPASCSRHWFIGGGFEGFWKESLFLAKDNHGPRGHGEGSLARFAVCRP